MTKLLFVILLSLPMSVRAADTQNQFLNLLNTITLLRSGVSLKSGTSESNTVPDVGWTPPANVEWIQHDFNASGDRLCDAVDGFCAGWLETASQECKDNFRFGDSKEDTQTRLEYEGCVYEMVFRPYLSMGVDRKTSELTDSQKENAARLKA